LFILRVSRKISGPDFIFVVYNDTRKDKTGGACRIFVGKSEGMRPLRRPKRRWVDNIKMDLREIEWDGLD
jgi:hypothetical protein